MKPDIDRIGWLFGLIREGQIRLKPLAHGLEGLVRELIDNDYTRYIRLFQSLTAEILRYEEPSREQVALFKQQVKYHASLVEAFTTIQFWDELARKFYGAMRHEHSTQRKLPNYRQLIECDSSPSELGKATRTNSRNHKKGIQGNKNRNDK